MTAKGKTPSPKAAPPSPKRRSFVASRQDEGLIEAPPAAATEEDIPLLTEVVDDFPASPAASVVAAPVSPAPEVLPEDIPEQMIRAIQERMGYELPTLVEAALLSASEELRKGIASTMEAALRDFAARHK